MPDLSKIYLFRMTHIENILHILQHGITHVSSLNANATYVSIGSWKWRIGLEQGEKFDRNLFVIYGLRHTDL